MTRQYVYILCADSAYEMIEDAMSEKFPSYEEDGSAIAFVKGHDDHGREIDATVDADPDEIREFLKTLSDIWDCDVRDDEDDE